VDLWRLRSRLAQIARETDVHEDALDGLEEERASIAAQLLGTTSDGVVSRPPGAIETVRLASSELGETFSAADVARVTGMHRDTATWALRELVKAGAAERGPSTPGIPVPHRLVSRGLVGVAS
jgi:Fic family protein